MASQSPDPEGPGRSQEHHSEGSNLPLASGRLKSRIHLHLPKVTRASWNLADQVLSALTNIVMSILVARNVDAEGFGSFAVAFLLFSLTVGVVRALVSSPLNIRHSAEQGAQRVVTVSQALGTALTLAIPVSVGLVAAGAVIGGGLGNTLAALAVVMPALVLQDTCRFAFFAGAQPKLATLNDLIWAVGQFSVSGVLIAVGSASPPALVLAWGAGAGIAALAGSIQLGARPVMRGFRGWMARHWDLTKYMLSEYLVTQGTFQGAILLLGGWLGVGNIGSLRAAQSLTGPLGIVSTAVTTFGIPEVSRRDDLPRRTMGIASAASASIFALGLAYTAMLLLIPDSLGTSLFGDTWAGAQDVLPAVAATSMMAGLRLGPVVFIYGRGLAKRSFPLVVTLSVFSLTFMAVGAARHGVAGLAWGMALAQLCVAPLWFAQLRRAVRLLRVQP